LVNKNVLSCLLKDGKEVNAISLVQRTTRNRLPESSVSFFQICCNFLHTGLTHDRHVVNVEFRVLTVNAVKSEVCIYIHSSHQ